MIQKILINDENRNKRADILATEALPSLSRAYVHKLFESGNITLEDGERLKAGYRLRLGNTLVIDFDEQETQTIEDIELPVIYEDNDVLVIDKPAGIISHSRGKFWYEPSVASFVRQKTGQEGERSGIVHRLDRVTSGVMICAKNVQAMTYLQKQFASRKVQKTYKAIVAGHMKESEAIIDMPIGRNANKPQTFHATKSGKDARTKYKVEKSFGNYDLLKLEPETGRTHQIRVHLKEVGHPIVGDHLYQGEEADRLYLHAETLSITLPSNETKLFTSPLPANFKKYEVSHG